MVHLIEIIGFSSLKSDHTLPVKNDPDSFFAPMLEHERTSLRLSF